MRTPPHQNGVESAFQQVAGEQLLQENLKRIEAELQAAGMPVTLEVTVEDRLRGAVCEALYWLDQNAPGRAYSVLLEALRIKKL